MTTEQITLAPITTPQHPDPAEARRFIRDEDGFYGYDYVFLEDATWHALCEIAHEQGRTVDGLCCDIDLNFAPGDPFAPRRAPIRPAQSPERSMTDKPAMKIAWPEPRSGSGQQIASLVPGAGEDFDKNLVAYKQRMKARTEAIKRHLAQFIEKTMHPADATCVTTALLDLGFEQQLDLHGEEDAKDLIDRAFRRVVKERRGPLQ